MTQKKRIFVYDNPGHPFQVQLSRALASQGHDVIHVFSASFQTPKGNLTKRASDPENFSIKGFKLDEEFQKDSFIKRRDQEIKFGNLVAEEIRRFKPDIVISGNTPLDSQKKVFDASKEVGAKFVFWLQDIISEAITRIIPKKIPVLGHAVAWHYRNLEYSLLRKSDHIVSITEDFVPILVQNGVRKDTISVIENWTPLDEVVPVARDNEWATANFAPGLRAVYSGTLGYKHNPGLLAKAAKTFPGTLYVFSEGRFAAALAKQAEEEKITNLQVRPWLPFSDLPKMLSGADIAIAMIEEDAGIFSVPSKVLTYLAAGRPILAAIPEKNLARAIILRENAGVLSHPNREDEFLEGLKKLAEDSALRDALGANGRAYAEATFDIDRITARFERIFSSL